MIVGIDLGTTNSLCAIFEDGQPRLIKNAHGSVLTPSVVGILESGHVLVGQSAKEYRVTHPERCASRFKQLMGTAQQLQLGDQKFNAPQLSSLILRSLKQDAENHLGYTIEEAVITVPAYFNDLQRRATRLAGELAGLKVRRIVNEPTAAALAYGFHDRNSEKHILVIDLGGGTFDVTLMEVFEGTLEIISTAGESMLGGEDFTDRLVAVMLQKQGSNLETVEMREPLRVARLRQLCETAKIQLASASTVQVPFPDSKGELKTDVQKFELTRDQFDNHVTPLLNRLLVPIHRVLRDGNRAPQDVDETIFVGGATRMSCVEDFLKLKLELKPQSRFNPDEVVALGAAVQAALITEDTAVEEMVLTDVCPHTLGVEVAKEFGSQLNTGYFSPIIHRNTTLPVSRETTLYTVAANQTQLNVRVYQGEGRRVKDNLYLGNLIVEGIPPGPAGLEFMVRFTYDLNGILEVEAFVPSSNQKFRTVLTQSDNSLTKAEIDAALKKMQGIKFYPRDNIENQRMLRYCERLVGEIGPADREQLEAALDQWERAMNSGDRELFEQSLLILRITLSQFGFDPQAPDSNPDSNGAT